MTRTRSTTGGVGRWGAVFIAVAAVAAGGCSSEHPPIETCEPGDGLTPDCRFHNPEDLVPSPSGRFILVSQFGSMEGARPGNLAAYDPESGDIEILFPPEGAAASNGGWGDPACTPPAPAAFAPHGIDIDRLDDGAHALYVVNHGGRESVEMFEVDDADQLTLTWRGCVLAPEEGNFNDLVVLRDGGFWVSQMYPRDANTLWTALRMRFTGYAPGFVYHWRPGEGFSRIPGTETKFANGVEKSDDERMLFVNSYFGNAVIKVDVERGEVIGSAEVSSPDNLAWSPEGSLLAASHHASIADTFACLELEEGSCGFRFQVVAIDSETMETRVLLDHAGPPMGAATVALPFGDSVYLGTFAGNRIARAPASILE